MGGDSPCGGGGDARPPNGGGGGRGVTVPHAHCPGSVQHGTLCPGVHMPNPLNRQICEHSCGRFGGGDATIAHAHRPRHRYRTVQVHEQCPVPTFGAMRGPRPYVPQEHTHTHRPGPWGCRASSPSVPLPHSHGGGGGGMDSRSIPRWLVCTAPRPWPLPSHGGPSEGRPPQMRFRASPPHQRGP